MIFKNASSQTIELFWVKNPGEEISYDYLRPQEEMDMNTFATYVFYAINVKAINDRMFFDGEYAFVPVPSDNKRTILIKPME